MVSYSDASMDLRDSIELIRHREKELRLFNVDPTDTIHDDLRTYFETLNVRITAGRTASGSPEDVAVLSNTSEVLATVDVATLRELLEDVPAGDGNLGIADGEYEGILRYLKETTFTSYDTEQLLFASREIEDRARRVGQGSIHAGFQQCSIMAEQQPVYSDLARRGVSVHAYGVPDATPPDLGSAPVHAVSTDEIAETWFVVFDGGGDDTQKSALLAHQRNESAFYGIWTYDPGFVDHILEYLNRTYDSPSDDVPSAL
ncbi:DICT sensory domain-containing protein [Halomicroarcula sp. GCM10025709]|uniref:DICT sensory domain-containing protein n=2 Tax=Haloarcula TaxID=2237 RepID=UPI003617BDAD